MGKGNTKAIKQHYQKILRDPERRKNHFGAGGALGSEAEGRDPMSKMLVDIHNSDVKPPTAGQQRQADENLDELKKGKKIKLGTV